MRSAFPLALVLVAAFAGYASADTAMAEDAACAVNGAAADEDAECRAQRAAHMAKIADCMTQLAADQGTVATTGAVKSSQGARARYTRCAATVSGMAQAPVE